MKKVVIPPMAKWTGNSAISLVAVKQLCYKSTAEIAEAVKDSDFVVAEELNESKAQYCADRLRSFGIPARVEKSDIVRCPMCGSKNVNRGGLLKSRNHCQKCGHKWTRR
jgi:hypothetical protein